MIKITWASEMEKESKWQRKISGMVVRGCEYIEEKCNRCSLTDICEVYSDNKNKFKKLGLSDTAKAIEDYGINC